MHGIRIVRHKKGNLETGFKAEPKQSSLFLYSTRDPKLIRKGVKMAGNRVKLARNRVKGPSLASIPLLAPSLDLYDAQNKEWVDNFLKSFYH
jgi:hypothetical protein